MKEEEIKELFEQFEAIANEYEGVECWSARELAQVLGYSQWRNFEGIIEKAKASCTNAGQEVSYHFADVSKMIDLGKGAQRELTDYALTRYACYLIAQNGDSTKNEIAFNDVFQIQPFSYKSKNERKKYIVQVSSFYSNQTYYWEKKENKQYLLFRI
jgi:DNA-damage-inducible protein D